MQTLSMLLAVLLAQAPSPTQGQPASFLSPPFSTAAARPKIEQINRRTRERMLAALTPGHRTFFAHLVGDLITTQSPDIPAAVRRLDGALTQSETLAIIHAQNDEFTAIQNLLNSGFLGPGMRRTGEHLRRVREPDAGRALLHSALLIGSYERK